MKRFYKRVELNASLQATGIQTNIRRCVISSRHCERSVSVVLAQRVR